jgi:hypothetical protein
LFITIVEEVKKEDALGKEVFRVIFLSDELVRGACIKIVVY